MSEAIKTFQTLDSNWKISLIILKGNLLHILKKLMLMHIIARKAKWKTVKNFEVVLLSGGNYPSRNSQTLEMSRAHLSWGSIILAGNCANAIIWGEFCYVGIVRRAIVRSTIVLVGNWPASVITNVILTGWGPSHLSQNTTFGEYSVKVVIFNIRKKWQSLRNVKYYSHQVWYNVLDTYCL